MKKSFFEMDKLEKIFPDQYKALSIPNKILIGLIACLFLIIIITIIALGASYHDCTLKPNFRIESKEDFLKLESHACMDLNCLRASAPVQDKMNQTFDPCTDFYNFVCGGFIIRHPVISKYEPISIIELMKIRSDTQLWKILEISDLEPPRTDTANFERYKNSAVRKLRDFYSMCVDDYVRTKDGAKSMYKLITETMQTVYLNDGLEKGNWTDFEDDLALTKTELMVDVFFVAKNNPDSIKIIDNRNKYSSHSNTKEDRKKKNEAFKELLSLIAGELFIGSNHSFIYERRNNFLNDIYKVNLLFDQNIGLNESEDETLPHYQGVESDPRDMFFTSYDHSHYNISIKSLQTNVIKIDLMKLMRLLISKESVTEDRQIVVSDRKFIYKLADLFEDVATNATKLRMVNNYMVYQIVKEYASVLSWKIDDAFKKYEGPAKSRYEFDHNYMPSWQWCLYEVQTKMYTVFLHEKIRLLVNDNSADMVKDMFNRLKQNFKLRISFLNWIDDKTKIKIKERIGGMTAESLSILNVNETYIDDLYKDLVINTTNGFIVSYINLLRVHKKLFLSTKQSRLSLGVDINLAKSYHELEISYMIMLNGIVYYSSNDLFIPIDYIGEPLFNSASPQLFNYASLGVLMASRMMFALLQLNDWSPETLRNIENIENCVFDYSNNYSQLRIKRNNITEISSYFGGMRLAYQTYKEVLKNKFEKIPIDLLGFTQEQLFFIISAQTMCTTGYEVYYPMRNVEKVNTMVSNFPEFGSAFNCPKYSNLARTSECKIY